MAAASTTDTNIAPFQMVKVLSKLGAVNEINVLCA